MLVYLGFVYLTRAAGLRDPPRLGTFGSVCSCQFQLPKCQGPRHAFLRAYQILRQSRRHLLKSAVLPLFPAHAYAFCLLVLEQSSFQLRILPSFLLDCSDGVRCMCVSFGHEQGLLRSP